MLHAKDPDLVARREARISVSHVQANPFLAHDDGSNIKLCRGLNQWINRIGKQHVDSLGLHGVGDSIHYVHGSLLQK